MRRHFPRARTAWIALAALSGAVAVGTATATPAAAEDIYPRPASGSWTIDGHGWGHGHGLSQYGAQGGATLGKSADTITSFYYPGTSKTMLANAPIRVLLQADDDNATEVYPSTGLVATDLATGTKSTLPTGYARWRAVIDSAGLHLQSYSPSPIGWKTQPMGGRTFFAGPLRFAGPAFVRLALPDGSSRDYRGAVQAVRTSPTTLASVDVLGLEDYLLGVVPRESSSSWLAAALQSQAIAARSYSAYKRDHVPSAASWDICDTTQCQVFGGSRYYSSSGTETALEAPSTSDAVRATGGVVRTYNGQAIFAEYSASNGGWSTDGGLPYLRAQRDDWDGVVASSVHSWTAALQVTDVERRYPAVGRLARMRVTSRDGNGDWGGRVGTVVLEGVDAAGNATSVTTTGVGIYNSRSWPANSDGLRSNWWRVRPSRDSHAVSRTGDPTLVKSPGSSRTTLSVLVENTGTTGWPVSGLHLAVATPPGAPDPLAGGSGTPGAYVQNRTHPGATTVLPGDRVDFNIAADAVGVPVGVRTASYRVQIGTGALFGEYLSWTVTVRAASFAARTPAAPTLVVTTMPAGGAGAPPALFADGRTVVVPRNGATVLRLSASPAGNLSWPVGSNSPLRLGTTSPRDRSSSFSGAGWLSGGRAAALAAGAPVPPGGTGTFDLRLNGNNAAVGVSREAFEPLWEGQSWTTGARSDLVVVRVDTTVSRAATTEAAPLANVALSNAPTGTGVIVVRLRNVGGSAWTVGQESLETSAPATMATSAWRSSTRPPALTSNASRPGQGAVHPGEVGEWRIPLTGFGKALGTTSMVLRAVGPSGAYGPSFTVSTKVFQATVAGQVVGIHPSVRVPSSGTAATWYDVRNIGNTPWPVGGAMHSLALTSGGSPSRATSWITVSRPGSLSANLSAPGSGLVLPGQTARFALDLAGNGRTPRSTSEAFGVIWDGFTGTTLRAVVPYSVG